MPTLKFLGNYENLAKICDFVVLEAKDAGLSEKAVYAVQLAVDEACSNIIEHAYGGEGMGDIKCTCEAVNDKFLVILQDKGRPFIPQSVPEPDLNAPLEEVKPRGAGLFLMHKLMDEVQFKSTEKSGNVLTMVKNRED